MPTPKTLNLPRPPFLWTLDQVAQILSMTQKDLESKYIHFENRNAGQRHTLDKIMARDIAPLSDDHAEWRVSETELTRWFYRKGFRPRYRSQY